MSAYIHGTSTRKVDDLVRALGCDSGVSKSTVSRICGEIDAEVAAFRARRLDHAAFPYVFCDATYVKARVDARVVSRAVVVATGVSADGTREVLAWTSATARTRCFGPPSCAPCARGGQRACAW